jgi:hypothetical protein
VPEKPRPPRPPAGLGARGRAFWKRTVAVYTLTDGEQVLLHEVCRSLDELELLEAVVSADGPMTEGSTGQRRVHPAVGELRGHRLAVARMLAQLDLPDGDTQTIPSPATLRGRRAAESRWGRRDALAAARRQRGALPA